MTPEERAEITLQRTIDARIGDRARKYGAIGPELKGEIAQAIRDAVAEEREAIAKDFDDASDKLKQLAETASDDRARTQAAHCRIHATQIRARKP